MKAIKPLMKTMRWMFLLLIGMISNTGFGLPSADPIQNSTEDSFNESLILEAPARVSLEDINIAVIDVGFSGPESINDSYILTSNPLCDTFLERSMLPDVVPRHIEQGKTQRPGVNTSNIAYTRKHGCRPRDGLINSL